MRACGQSMLAVLTMLLVLCACSGSLASNTVDPISPFAGAPALCCCRRVLAIPDHWRDEYEAALAPGEPA